MIKKSSTTNKVQASQNEEPVQTKVSQLQSERLQTEVVTWPNEYDGMSYSNIIEAWLQQKGIYGGVAEGARNNMFYQLAMDLRYICNFKKDWLLQVMPSWELPLAERTQVIQSALNRPQGRAIPDSLQSAIDKVKQIDNYGDLDEQAVSNELRNPLPKSLPYVFRLIARRWPNNPHAMIMCSLPPLGALCTNIRADYIDGEEESPQFYCILTAPQASGKKVARKLDKLLIKPIADHDDEQRAELREFKKEQRKRKNEKANKQPDEPDTNIRKVPANISKRVFLERSFYAEGKSLYSFGEELDSLTKGMKSGSWADLTDILRMAFDGGEFGQDYASENSFNAVVQARWCILMCGTWGAVERFFPNLEDGTMTRFMFAQLEDNSGKPLLPKSKKGVNRDEEAISDEALRLYDLGSSDLKHRISLPTTQNALLEWQSLQLKIYHLGGGQDKALDTLRRRAMLIGFRAALVAAATEKMKDSSTIADFAVWVAQEVLDQQMALFGKELNNVNQHEKTVQQNSQSQMRLNSNLRLLAELPDEFTSEDVCKIYTERGYSDSTGYSAVHRWVNKGLIKRENKKYIKVQK